VKLVCSSALTEREPLARNRWPALDRVTANMKTDELGNLGLNQAQARVLIVVGRLRAGRLDSGKTPTELNDTGRQHPQIA
jgi:hypothetical protein